MEVKNMVETRKLTGWSRQGRPFTPSEFQKTYIKTSLRGSYPSYLEEFARQYKKPTLRKFLIKKR